MQYVLYYVVIGIIVALLIRRFTNIIRIDEPTELYEEAIIIAMWPMVLVHMLRDAPRRWREYRTLKNFQRVIAEIEAELVAGETRELTPAQREKLLKVFQSAAPKDKAK